MPNCCVKFLSRIECWLTHTYLPTSSFLTFLLKIPTQHQSLFNQSTSPCSSVPACAAQHPPACLLLVTYLPACLLAMHEHFQTGFINEIALSLQKNTITKTTSNASQQTQNNRSRSHSRGSGSGGSTGAVVGLDVGLGQGGLTDEGASHLS